MPTLSRFYGIVIRMYLAGNEHNPPHIHAIYNEDVAAIDIMTGNVIVGSLPAHAMKLVQEWLSANRASLLEIWNTQEFQHIPPLA